MLVLFGLLSAAFSTFAFLPYVVDTLERRTQPLRATWLIWGVLASISFVSQLAEGASVSLWFAGVQTGGTLVILLLSIWFGTGGYVNLRDGAVLALAALGLLLWFLTDSAVYALGIAISVSLLGGSVTVWKAFRDPGSETMSTWALGLVASVFGLWSVGAPDPVLIAYPLYLITLNAAIVVAMIVGMLRDKTGPVAAPA